MMADQSIFRSQTASISKPILRFIRLSIVFQEQSFPIRNDRERNDNKISLLLIINFRITAGKNNRN